MVKGLTILVLSLVTLSVFGQSGKVTSLIIDDDQNIYLGSTTGLSRMDAENRQVMRILDGVSVSALAWSKRHGVYVACNGNEIWTPDGKKFISLDGPDIRIRCMMISGAQIWAGTNAGVFVISIGRQEIAEHYTTQNSELGSDHVNTMYVDGSGIKWIGTDNGVVRIEGEKRWRMYEENTRFTAIAGSNEGVWVAGETEMWLVDPYNRWTPTDVKTDLSVGEMRSVASDRQGRIYLLSDIFVQFDPYTDVALPIEEQSATTVAQNVAMAVDNKDHLWIASATEELKMIDPETSIVETPMMVTLFVKHPACAQSKDGSVAINIQGGRPPYRYYWDHNALHIADNATDLPAGTYAVTVMDNAGNEYSDAADLIDPVAIHATIAEDSNAEGFSLMVNASGGRGDLTYQWSDGGTDRKIPVDAPGIYSATVTDVNGCSVVAAYTVEPTVFAIAVPDEEEMEPEEVVDAVTAENLRELDAAKLNVGQVLRIEQLLFMADSANIEPESHAVLDGIYSFLNNNQGVIVEIGGHTNGLPDHEYCDRLSTARARSVAEYIVSQGIPADRITYYGYGKRQPVASNQTVDGRRKNQRVEVKILQM